MRYKAWRSTKDHTIHLIYREGEFDRIPDQIRNLGPWVEAKEGEIEHLKLPYRMTLAEQGFAVVHQSVTDFSPEVA
jgi:hypothetical protein